MPHVPIVSHLRIGMTSRRLGNPGTREVDEEYNPDHNCRHCVNLVYEDSLFRCESDSLGRTYRGIASLESPYPRNVAASCENYLQRDGTFGKEG